MHCLRHGGAQELKKFIVEVLARMGLGAQIRQTDAVYFRYTSKMGNGSNKGDMFMSDELPEDVTVEPDVEVAMKLYCSSADFPPHLRTRNNIKALAGTRLYKSFCCANRNREVEEHNNHISTFVQEHYQEPVITVTAQEDLCKTGQDHASTVLATPKYLANYKDSSVPRHELHLFRGCRISLMRNLMLSRGCATGVPFIVLSVGRHIVECMNISPGPFFGEIEFFFRIKIQVTLPGQFSFTRLQFPMRIAFAGTTHRFQGDSLDKDALLFADARYPPFCHGQTYVLMSRAQRGNQVIMVPESGIEDVRKMPAMAFHELLNWKHAYSQPSEIPDQQSTSWFMPQHMDTPLQSSLYQSHKDAICATADFHDSGQELNSEWDSFQTNASL